MPTGPTHNLKSTPLSAKQTGLKEALEALGVEKLEEGGTSSTGDIQGMKEAVEALAKSHPHLFGAGETPPEIDQILAKRLGGVGNLL